MFFTCTCDVGQANDDKRKMTSVRKFTDFLPKEAVTGVEDLRAY